MKRFLAACVAIAWMGCAWAADVPDSRQLEADIQRLPWKQFRSVIEAVPNLRADVERYGPAGWAYVKSTYRTHGWRKNIDKLDAEQKARLAALIEKAKAGR